jgi:hypothetical protein
VTLRLDAEIIDLEGVGRVVMHDGDLYPIREFVEDVAAPSLAAYLEDQAAGNSEVLLSGTLTLEEGE